MKFGLHEEVIDVIHRHVPNFRLIY